MAEVGSGGPCDGEYEPRRSAPYTFATTETFLAAFAMESSGGVPDPEQLADAGLDNQ